MINHPSPNNYNEYFVAIIPFLLPFKSIHWYGLLRCQYAGKRPELKVSLTVEQDSSLTSSYSTNEEEERKCKLNSDDI